MSVSDVENAALSASLVAKEEIKFSLFDDSESIEDSYQKETFTFRSSATSADLSAIADRVNTAFIEDDAFAFEAINYDHNNADIMSETTSEVLSPESSSESSKASDTKEPIVDRTMYYKLHDLYLKEVKKLEIRNRFLESYMVGYFMKRKMFLSLERQAPQKPGRDEELKYPVLLTKFEVFADNYEKEEQALTKEISKLKSDFHRKTETVEELYQTLLKQENDVIKQLLVNTSPTKTKHVEKLISRQKSSMEMLIKMRRSYIKVRNKCTELEEKLEILNTSGPYPFTEYEELSSDNRTLFERLQEKTLLLHKLKKKCSHTMQVLAHNREKVVALSLNTGALTEQLEELSDRVMSLREQISSLKFDRNLLRTEMHKIKEKTGLVGYMKFLRDMESTVKDLEEGKIRLEKYKTAHLAASEQIKALRRHTSKETILEYEKRCRRLVSMAKKKQLS